MNESEKFIKAVSTPSVISVHTNTPPQYKDRKRQFLADRRQLFDEARDYLATDYVRARVQGIGRDFYDWVETDIRLSDVSTQSVTAFDSKEYDNFKEILFRDRRIDYIPPGALVETMGSYWLVVNPSNMSSGVSNAVIARCRAAFNFYDEYGNIKSEPLVIDRRIMLSNRNNIRENPVLPEGYFSVKCQRNKNTERLLEDNKRIILGNKAYYITGFTDFIEEFTGDFDSAKTYAFTIRREEPEEHDDMVNRISDGLMYHWDATAQLDSPMVVGNTAQLTAYMTLNGDAVEPTEDAPQTWTYESSNEAVAEVGEDGMVSAIAEGECIITATLTQNPNLSVSVGCSVRSESETLDWETPLPETLKQYSSVTLTAVHRVNGVVDTSAPIEWSFFNASKDAYHAETNGNTAVITSLGFSNRPLAVTATCGSVSVTAKIRLIAY